MLGGGLPRQDPHERIELTTTCGGVLFHPSRGGVSPNRSVSNLHLQDLHNPLEGRTKKSHISMMKAAPTHEVLADLAVDAGIPDDVGRRIRDERRARKLSQQRLATRAGLGRETIYRVENGRRPTAHTLALIEAGLRVGSPFFVPRLDGFQPRDEPGLGPRTRLRRREMKMTLQACALAAGVSVATLSRFERGAERCPSLAVVKHGITAVGIGNAGLAATLDFVDVADMTRYCLA